jgi:hypothetical protein
MSFENLSMCLLHDKFRLCLEKVPKSFQELKEIAESQFDLKNRIMTYLTDQGEFLKISNNEDYMQILSINLESDSPVIVISFEKPKIFDKLPELKPNFEDSKPYLSNRSSFMRVDDSFHQNQEPRSPAKSIKKFESYRAADPIQEDPSDLLLTVFTAVDIQIIGDLCQRLKERPSKTVYFRWKIQNICNDTLPRNLKLVKIKGNLDGLPSNILELQPHSTTELSIKVVAPRDQGFYRSEWQIFNNKSEPIGSSVVIELDVVDQADNTEKTAKLMDMGFNEHSVRRALIDTNGDFEAALELLISAQYS